MFSAEIWFMKTSTRITSQIMNYESLNRTLIELQSLYIKPLQFLMVEMKQA